jgi:putative NADH-flavin reductase
MTGDRSQSAGHRLPPSLYRAMNVAILGATGRTGHELIGQALARGYSVTALARDPARLNLSHDRLRVVAGDIGNPEAVEAVVSGQDAVLSVLANRMGLTGIPRTTLFSDGARAVVAAMRANGTKRLVFCTSDGVEKNDPNAGAFYRRVIKPLFLQRGHDDMVVAESVIRASEVDWVLVRSTRLIDRHASQGRFRVSPRYTPVGGYEICRADLACFMLDQAASDAWLRGTPTIAY